MLAAKTKVKKARAKYYTKSEKLQKNYYFLNVGAMLRSGRVRRNIRDQLRS